MNMDIPFILRPKINLFSFSRRSAPELYSGSTDKKKKFWTRFNDKDNPVHAFWFCYLYTLKAVWMIILCALHHPLGTNRDFLGNRLPKRRSTITKLLSFSTFFGIFSIFFLIHFLKNMIDNLVIIKELYVKRWGDVPYYILENSSWSDLLVVGIISIFCIIILFIFLFLIVTRRETVVKNINN